MNTNPRSKLQIEIRTAEKKLAKIKEQVRKARATFDFKKEDELTEKAWILISEISGMQAELEAMQESR